MVGRWLIVVLVVAGGCKSRDGFAPQASPNGELVLKPSLYEGNLVRITISAKSNGAVIDDARTRDTQLMKWVSGWLDDKSYLFWGSDTGTSWVRTIDGSKVTDAPLEGSVACRRLEKLFEEKYGEARGNCLKYTPKPAQESP